MPTVDLAVVAAPGLPHDLAGPLADELAERLRSAHPELEWRLPVVEDALVRPPASTSDVLDAARRRLLASEWDLVVALTDLPLRVGRRAVAGRASPTHRVALVSIPALGAVSVARRLRDTVLALIDDLVGADADATGTGEEARRARRRLREVAELDAPGDRALAGFARGRLGLLGGMIRANRPWRVAARLYRALVAALAATAFALVTSDIWRIADALGVERLAALAVLALAATTVSLIGVHGLWERAPERSARDQVALFNAATAITVLIGLTTLYAALFALALGAAALLLPAGVIGDAVGGDASAGTYVRLAWFVSSLAMVGGALGAGLESGDDVREAAYGAREDATFPTDS